jgi:hypothetical protein
LKQQAEAAFDGGAGMPAPPTVAKRPLVWKITSFTAGHSATLALASLGAVHVPQAPIETAIALSIYSSWFLQRAVLLM